MGFKDELTTFIKPGEAEVELIRPHPVTMMPSVGGGTLLLIVDFFLIAWWFRSGTWGTLGFSFVLALASVLVLRGVYAWAHNVLLITTRRIVDVSQEGFFRRTVSEASYEKMQDVRYEINGVWQTMFQFGSVVVQTAGTSTTIEISGIHHPQDVQRLITDTQTAARSAMSSRPNGKTTDASALSAQELVALVNRIKEHLGPEAFRKFIKEQPPKADGPE